MYDANEFDRVDSFAEAIGGYVADKEVPPGTEIVLVVDKDDIGHDCGNYYLVCHDARSIFWADDVDVELLTNGEWPVVDELQLRHASEAQYWLHASLYPRLGEITQTIIDDLDETLRFCATDAMTSRTSTSPFGKDELMEISRIMTGVRPGRNVRSFWSIARWQDFFIRSRFNDCYGQRHARLQRNHSIFDDSPDERSWPFVMLSRALFYTPDRYMEKLNNIWIDECIIEKEWVAFMTVVQKDWVDTIVPTTVLLSANVGILAINSIDKSGAFRSFAQIASYISAFLSLGNLIVCTVLARQHDSTRNTAAEAAHYLESRGKKPLGLEALAITFSLPSAFFLWGIIMFYAALAWVCLHDTNTVTAAATGIVLGTILFVLCIVICLDWRTEQPDHSLWRRSFDALKQHSWMAYPRQQSTLIDGVIEFFRFVQNWGATWCQGVERDAAVADNTDGAPSLPT